MDYRDVLPSNTLLDGKYRIERVLGAGGFGITYEATDVGLDMPVAVKEYFPSEFALRDTSKTVRARSEKHRPLFDHLRTSFLREAQTLAQFDDPSIVRVISFFSAHGTAYMVMRYEVGLSMKAWLADLGRFPTQGELDRILVNILRALQLMHARDFLHRDIATDNIVLRPDGHPVLIDFGSSRRVVAETTGTLTGIVKQGFSPPEQYSPDSKSQGPWTDIYALGATLYHCVTGKMPPDGMARMLQDDLVSSGNAAASSYRAGFLEAIDWALEVRPKQRPQNVAEWRAALLAGTGLEDDTFINPSHPVVSSPLFGVDGREGAAPLVPGHARSAPSRSSSRSSRPSGPSLRRSTPRNGGASRDPSGPAADAGTGPSEPSRRIPEWRKLAGLAAAIGGFLLIGTMILFGFSPSGTERRVDQILATPRLGDSQVAAPENAARTSLAEQERVAAEIRKKDQEDALRQRLAAETQRRALADAEQQRLEAERVRQAEEARRRALADAEQQRQLADAERLRQTAAAEARKQTEQELLARQQLLGAEQREEFLRQVQVQMKAHSCYDGEINGQESDALQALAAFRQRDSSIPQVELPRLTVAEAEGLLAWLAAHTRPVCQGTTIQERQLEKDRLDKDRARRQQDAERVKQRAIEEKAQQREAERARQRERNAASAAAERKAADRAAAARNNSGSGSGGSSRSSGGGSSGGGSSSGGGGGNVSIRVPSF